MRYASPLLISLLCLSGCKPDHAEPAAETKPSSAKAAAPEPPKAIEPKVTKGYEPPVVAVPDEQQKLQAYLREERIKQIEAAKLRLEKLMEAYEPEHVATDAEILRALGHSPTTLESRMWPYIAEKYRADKAKSRERHNRAIEEAQAHLRSLLLGSDEKRISIPVK